MVSSFGGEGEFNTGYLWRLEIERSGKTCRLDQRVRLHHVDTGGYRHKHDEIYAKMDHTNLGFQVSYLKKKKE